MTSHRRRVALIILAVLVPLAMLSVPALAGEQKLAQTDPVAKKLKAAVAAGKLTEAQAKDQWFYYQLKVYLAKMSKKLKAAVKAGKLTEVQATAKWKAIMKKVALKKAAYEEAKAAKQKAAADEG